MTTRQPSALQNPLCSMYTYMCSTKILAEAEVLNPSNVSTLTFLFIVMKQICLSLPLKILHRLLFICAPLLVFPPKVGTMCSPLFNFKVYHTVL